ncbi:hypothetical protein SeMB42_g01277 [Synchytrium endobioticum]|uniref:Rad26/CSB-like winged helix DNA-binding domain-containing protein n=1 Tax=Synchytrium endobioticum TaxID=286115 RepID=A0A507DLR6_9FUNG|nr:hypothetical protein SeMB42_g01277 [Synchytrium endobioticum]
MSNDVIPLCQCLLMALAVVSSAFTQQKRLSIKRKRIQECSHGQPATEGDLLRQTVAVNSSGGAGGVVTWTGRRGNAGAPGDPRPKSQAPTSSLANAAVADAQEREPKKRFGGGSSMGSAAPDLTSPVNSLSSASILATLRARAMSGAPGPSHALGSHGGSDDTEASPRSELAATDNRSISTNGVEQQACGHTRSSPAPNIIANESVITLAQGIQYYLQSQPDHLSTSNNIVNEFKEQIKNQKEVFKKLLKNLADFTKLDGPNGREIGIWTLKEEFHTDAAEST